MIGHESPYPAPPGPGVLARVVLARDASYWLPDIEAYLVEQQLSTALAPTIVALMNAHGGTVAGHVEALRQVLDAHTEIDDHHA